MNQVEGYRAFLPAPLPPSEPPIRFDTELLRLLSHADRAIGRLDGVTARVPNPDIFVAMYVRQEAVLSSQIEGTQSTLEDVLRFEIGAGGADQPKDVEEVVNYVRAMNYGLNRMAELPLSKRLIREIHSELMSGVRGGDKEPGEFRRSQNWIGPAGCPLSRATFVPPPVGVMAEALTDLERFLHDETLPVLVQCGLVHAQFETIHPFLDGNGRVGRLLITFLLCQRGVLRYPLLYLSVFLKEHRAEYYDRLMAVRLAGDWEGWLRFFLSGVAEVSAAAAETADRIFDLRERLRGGFKESSRLGTQSWKLLDKMFEHPVFTAKMATEWAGTAASTASQLLMDFESRRIVTETTGQKRNRRYQFTPYLALFPASTRPVTAPPGDRTGSSSPA